MKMVIFHSHVNVYQRVLFIGHLQWKTKGETRYPIFGDHPSNSTSQQVPFGEMPCLRSPTNPLFLVVSFLDLKKQDPLTKTIAPCVGFGTVS